MDGAFLGPFERNKCSRACAPRRRHRRRRRGRRRRRHTTRAKKKGGLKKSLRLEQNLRVCVSWCGVSCWWSTLSHFEVAARFLCKNGFREDVRLLDSNWTVNQLEATVFVRGEVDKKNILVNFGGFLNNFQRHIILSLLLSASEGQRPRTCSSCCSCWC